MKRSVSKPAIFPALLLVLTGKNGTWAVMLQTKPVKTCHVFPWLVQSDCQHLNLLSEFQTVRLVWSGLLQCVRTLISTMVYLLAFERQILPCWTYWLVYSPIFIYDQVVGDNQQSTYISIEIFFQHTVLVYIKNSSATCFGNKCHHQAVLMFTTIKVKWIKLKLLHISSIIKL
jgi:hypothetical protein